MDAEVAIVGGGPAGSATALFLAAAAPALRERIAVIDQASFPRDKICAGALGGRGDRLLGTIGVRVEVPSLPIRGMSVTTQHGSLSARLPKGQPIGRVVRRIEFDRALLDEVRGRGIRVYEGVKLARLRQGAARVELETSQGRLEVGAVVGADGVGSAVRRCIGAPRGHYYAQAVEAYAPARGDDGAADQIHFDLRDRSLVGYGWNFPALGSNGPMRSHGLYRLVSGMGPSGPRPALADHMRRYLAEQGIAPEAVRLRQYAERGLAVHEPCASGRVILVGEAAGICPTLGEGMAQALGYGALAGRYLARRLTKGAADFADFSRVIARSLLGLELRIRCRALPWIYGRWRNRAERCVSRSQDLAEVGMHNFAGLRCPPGPVLRALAHVLWATSGGWSRPSD